MFVFWVRGSIPQAAWITIGVLLPFVWNVECGIHQGAASSPRGSSGPRWNRRRAFIPLSPALTSSQSCSASFRYAERLS